MSRPLAPHHTLAAVASLLLWLAPLALAGDDPERTLVVLTWSDYLDPEVAAEFERRHDARLKFVYFANDYDRDTRLASSDGQGYDLILINGVKLDLYARSGWLTPLDDERVPNRRHLEATWQRMFPGAERYGAAYFWGTLGIAYRRDLVPEPLVSWKQLVEPREELRQRIAMVKSDRDLLTSALKLLGHSVNTDDPGALRAAGALLERQKPYVKSYAYLSLSEESALVKGEVWVAMMYNGDVLMLKEHQADIEYVVPEEGSNLWVDYWTVMASSRRKALAYAFVDFLNDPEIAARNAQFVYYATPNKAAEAHLPPDYFEDPVIYPSPEVLARSEPYRKLPPRSQKLLNGIFSRLVN
jgi:spermidine/putrescine transport system substrate-binding protein